MSERDRKHRFIVKAADLIITPPGDDPPPVEEFRRVEPESETS